MTRARTFFGARTPFRPHPFPLWQHSFSTSLLLRGLYCSTITHAFKINIYKHFFSSFVEPLLSSDREEAVRWDCRRGMQELAQIEKMKEQR